MAPCDRKKSLSFGAAPTENAYPLRWRDADFLRPVYGDDLGGCSFKDPPLGQTSLFYEKVAFRGDGTIDRIVATDWHGAPDSQLYSTISVLVPLTRFIRKA